VSILRNKIHDLVATRRVEVAVDTIEADGDDDVGSKSLFDTHGSWIPGARPQAWGDPEATMEQKQFWSTFQGCLRGMPARLQEVFVLREIMGEPIEEICKNLGISQTNCSVMLYRARMRLRPCLQANWHDATG
jgi:RNA polymerase sigma-70 factor (ECF subfamily)